MYVTQKAIKVQALADYLAENPVNEEYEPLKTYFHDEEVSFLGEDISETYPGWRLFFDGAENHKGRAKLQFNCTNNMDKYEACILGLKMAINMNVHKLFVIADLDLLIHQVQGEWAVKNPKITPFGVPKFIITYKGANLNSHLMRDICEQFKITHRISTAYRRQ
ncbi:uncharacterized protein LOC107027703 [Solanum pennellii]|uniref:Uncharacterized protein LOC107027703 n=1 Tax=Solanum pennellii TaxID=28526 RepID=A0ABM1HE98_SOLPN|nr:uncharacterized protein LOC107027703 [Solanum pennellii]